jgi:hypothetical protein
VAGTLTRFVGSTASGTLVDGVGTSAVFNIITSLTFAPDGDLMMIDFNNRAIRRAAPDGMGCYFIEGYVVC